MPAFTNLWEIKAFRHPDIPNSGNRFLFCFLFRFDLLFIVEFKPIFFVLFYNEIYSSQFNNLIFDTNKIEEVTTSKLFLLICRIFPHAAKSRRRWNSPISFAVTYSIGLISSKCSYILSLLWRTFLSPILLTFLPLFIHFFAKNAFHPLLVSCFVNSKI